MSGLEFDVPTPHVIDLTVDSAQIDAYEHVNNAVYLTWLDAAAWSHSSALGVSAARCVQLRRGMAARRIEIEFLRAALSGDTLKAATWIVGADAKLRAERRFQIVRSADGATLARARADYVCINLDTGRATRMPEEFARAYVVSTRL
jgi:acyl-CoA thioester hydrolase